MRVFLTGATGFVGSNIARVFAERHGAELFSERVELTDPAAVARSVGAFEPDAVVHAAILNDFGRLYARRREAWDHYVGATRTLADAANAADAQLLLVSTDWVFDGTQAGATEDTPPNPINLYGFLKAACELVVLERAERGAVARISGVNGVHWVRPASPRSQDAGFGYFVSALVDALRAGRRFTVWESPAINMVATPTLASDAAELMWLIVSRRLTGVFHSCGGEAIDRLGLARSAVDVFELDGDLLDSGPPDPEALPPGAVPHDTSLSAELTAATLGVELPSVETMLRRMHAELDSGRIGRDALRERSPA
jgi:dTDP-4-dehydrorhamnose reductase